MVTSESSPATVSDDIIEMYQPGVVDPAAVAERVEEMSKSTKPQQDTKRYLTLPKPPNFAEKVGEVHKSPTITPELSIHTTNLLAEYCVEPDWISSNNTFAAKNPGWNQRKVLNRNTKLPPTTAGLHHILKEAGITLGLTLNGNVLADFGKGLTEVWDVDKMEDFLTTYAATFDTTKMKQPGYWSIQNGSKALFNIGRGGTKHSLLFEDYLNHITPRKPKTNPLAAIREKCGTGWQDYDIEVLMDTFTASVRLNEDALKGKRYMHQTGIFLYGEQETGKSTFVTGLLPTGMVAEINCPISAANERDLWDGIGDAPFVYGSEIPTGRKNMEYLKAVIPAEWLIVAVKYLYKKKFINTVIWFLSSNRTEGLPPVDLDRRRLIPVPMLGEGVNRMTIGHELLTILNDNGGRDDLWWLVKERAADRDKYHTHTRLKFPEEIAARVEANAYTGDKPYKNEVLAVMDRLQVAGTRSYFGEEQEGYGWSIADMYREADPLFSYKDFSRKELRRYMEAFCPNYDNGNSKLFTPKGEDTKVKKQFFLTIEEWEKLREDFDKEALPHNFLENTY